MTTENRNTQTIGVSMEGLTLRVTDVERSLAFYKVIPGVEEIAHRPGEFALLSVGKGLIGLLKYGATHVEFGTSDVDGLYQHLKEVGFPVEGAPSQKPWGEYTFTVHDPDGHVLEFDDSHGV
jgi:catechol 2,3-dioxygenase-like lactoylglutathione lyase family enzyme